MTSQYAIEYILGNFWLKAIFGIGAIILLYLALYEEGLNEKE